MITIPWFKPQTILFTIIFFVVCVILYQIFRKSINIPTFDQYKKRVIAEVTIVYCALIVGIIIWIMLGGK